jgi:hypothetical protein
MVEYKTIIDSNGDYVIIIKNGIKDYELGNSVIPELFSMEATLERIDRFYFNMLMEKFIDLGCSIITVKLKDNL